jgi:hypothetical protein
MKQFLITAAGVFAGLTIFLIGVPFVLLTLALAAVVILALFFRPPQPRPTQPVTA